MLSRPAEKCLALLLTWGMAAGLLWTGAPVLLRDGRELLASPGASSALNWAILGARGILLAGFAAFLGAVGWMGLRRI